MSTSKHRFYAPPDHISADHVVLPLEEARHALKVLRLGPGDEITVVDGAGMTYAVELDTVAKKTVVGRITGRARERGEPSFELHAGLALLKHGAKWETFLEKAVELGCTRITPLITSRTEKNRFNTRRARSILISAMKQSGRSRLALLDDPVPMSDLLSDVDAEVCRLICHENAMSSKRLMSSLDHDTRRACVFIGPEGGFSDDEIKRATDTGWTDVWLGARQLRAETAAIVAISVLSQAMDTD